MCHKIISNKTFQNTTHIGCDIIFVLPILKKNYLLITLNPKFMFKKKKIQMTCSQIMKIYCIYVILCSHFVRNILTFYMPKG